MAGQFLFVQWPSGVEPPKLRELRDAEARSHASRVSHERKKQGRGRGRGRVHFDSRGAHGAAFHTFFQRPKHGDHGGDRDGDRDSDRDGDQDVKFLVAASAKAHAMQQRQLITSHLFPGSCGLQTIITQSKYDPFSSTPVGSIPRHLMPTFHYVWDVVWPTLVSVDVTPWRKAGIQHPALFHTQIAGITGVFLISQPNSELAHSMNIVRLHHITEAMKLVRNEIANTKVPPTDAVIMAVLNLIGYSADIDETKVPDSHPQSPLAVIHHLDRFGKLTYTESHRNALMALLKRKGGLQRIKLAGLKDLLCLVDVQYATIVGTTPFIHQIFTTEPLASSGKHILDPEALFLASQLGHGFTSTDLLGQDLSDTLDLAAETTVALDHHQRGGPTPPLMSDIVNSRDHLQYKLLHLPSRHKQSDLLYEACRNALLIYSDMVLWPTPACKRVKARLALSLRVVLETTWIQRCWQEHQGLLDWITLLGVIAASFTEDRPWYVAQLQQHGKLDLLDWDSFKHTMRRYLWWDYVFDSPGLQIWTECQDNKHHIRKV